MDPYFGTRVCWGFGHLKKPERKSSCEGSSILGARD